jgi:hypothetical protein
MLPAMIKRAHYNPPMYKSDRFFDFICKKVTFSLICVTLLIVLIDVESVSAQQTLEFDSGSVTDVNDVGPLLSTSFRLRRNTDNPGGTNFFDYWPETNVTLTIDYTNISPIYSNVQNTDLDTGDPTNPPVVFGWFFDTITTGNPNIPFTEAAYLKNGARDPLVNLIDFISNPLNENFVSSTSTAAGDDPSGINVDTNYGALLAAGFSGLEGLPMTTSGTPIDYVLADLIIDFDVPVSDPIIHFGGMGANWNTRVQFGTIINENVNSATLEFDLIDSTPGSVSLQVLDGTTNFGIINTDRIANNSDTPANDFNDTFGTSANTIDNGNTVTTETLTNGSAASGSVQVVGDDITQLVFRVIVQSRINADEDIGWAGGTGTWQHESENFYFQTLANDDLDIDDGGTPADQTDDAIIVTKNATSNGTANVDPTYTYAEDAVMISVSADLNPDEETVTVGPCYRTLSSPVASVSSADGTTVQPATYNDVIGSFWTQGVANADHEPGDTNIFLWPAGGDDTSGGLVESWLPIPGAGVEEPLTPGRGFLMSVFTDDTFGVDGSWTGGKLMTITGSEPPSPVELDATNLNTAAGEWNLFGNPFKEPVSFTNFQAANSSLETVVYVYDRNKSSTDSRDTDLPTDPSINGGWVSYTVGGGGIGDLTDGIIYPYQGFFVQNQSSITPPIQFVRENIVVPDATTGGFYGKENERRNYVRFEISGERLFDSAWVRFSDRGSFDDVAGDALKLMPFSTEYSIFGARKSTGTITDIGHFPIPEEDMELNMSFESTMAGEYTITATDLDLSFGKDLFLVDLVENVSIPVDENLEYTFSITNSSKSVNKGLNACLASPQKAQITSATDRFLITTQPKEFGSELPSDVALEQNYPNPFNPTTQITYQLPQQSDVRLQVFDMAGRQVATLVNESVSAGTHTVNFDASNLSSGIYLYKLQTGSAVITRKLTLIK